MRTTINIDSDVLAAAKELARDQNLAVGKVVSQLLRDRLTGRDKLNKQIPPTVGGFHPLPSKGRVVANDSVNTLRDTEGV